MPQTSGGLWISGIARKLVLLTGDCSGLAWPGCEAGNWHAIKMGDS